MTKIAAYDDIIWGIGVTESAAREDVKQWIDHTKPTNQEWLDNLDTAEMTPALAAEIESRGGNIGFGKLPDGRIGTPAEVVYAENASSWDRWVEYVDTNGTTTREEFDAMSLEQRIDLQRKAFGT